MGYEEERTQRRLAAAKQLDELAQIIIAMAADLRANADVETAGRDAWLRSNDTAYARLYWLRHRLGKIVAPLGVGLPQRWALKLVEHEYGEEAGWKSPLRLR